ncbi:MAG: rhomboid family intramembrane serine protease [Sphingobacteriales bacterium]
MAFGFSPKYITNISFENLTHQQFLVLAIEAATQLGWNVGYKSETGFIAYTPFSLSSWSEEVKVEIVDDSAILKSECTGTQMVDWGKNKRNVEDLVNTFDELKKSFSEEDIAKKYEDLKPTLVSKEEDQISRPPATTKEKITGFFAIFKPTQGYFVTPIIINLNIAVFILMVISGADFLLPDTQTLVAWGANFKPVTLQGEWWRLLTSCFIHIGIIHLLMNMFALLYIGLLLEPYLGKLRFAAAYLLTGIVSSMASLCWHDLTVSAGASGAIFGMYGVFLAMLTTNFIERAARRALLTSIAIFVGYNLMNGMKEGIDNAAHVGGLACGLLIGYSYYPSLKAPQKIGLQSKTVLALTVIIIFTCSIVYGRIPNDLGEYDQKMKSFVSMESMALEIYSMPKNAPKDSLLSEVKDRGIYYWNQNIKLLESLKKLNLPDQIQDRDQALMRYCQLRINCYHLIYKAIDENSDKYKDSINVYNRNIEHIIDSLKGK